MVHEFKVGDRIAYTDGLTNKKVKCVVNKIIPAAEVLHFGDSNESLLEVTQLESGKKSLVVVSHAEFLGNESDSVTRSRTEVKSVDLCHVDQLKFIVGNIQRLLWATDGKDGQPVWDTDKSWDIELLTDIADLLDGADLNPVVTEQTQEPEITSGQIKVGDKVTYLIADDYGDGTECECVVNRLIPRDEMDDLYKRGATDELFVEVTSMEDGRSTILPISQVTPEETEQS